MRIIRITMLFIVVFGAALASASNVVLINELRTGLITEDTVVDLRDARVIAVAETGLAVDDLEPGTHHNIWIRAETVGLIPGDIVQIYNATYQEQGGMSVLDVTLGGGSVVWSAWSSVPIPQPILYTPETFLLVDDGYESALITIDSSFYITIIDPVSGWLSRAHPSYLEIPFSGIWIDKSEFEAMDCYADPVGILVQEDGVYKLAPTTEGFQLGDCAAPNDRIPLSVVKSYYR